MGCWNELDLTLKYEILVKVAPTDLLTCQSVSKSFREVALDLFYSTLEIDDPKTATVFLQGQLQALEPRGGLFVTSISIAKSFAPKVEQPALPREAMRLFARLCPNVQYVVGHCRHHLFWNALRTLHFTDVEYWPQLKSIPFHYNFSQEYLYSVLEFSKSITNLTIKDLPKDVPQDKGVNASREMFAFIKAKFPRVESLEIFGRKVKHLFELNDLTFFIPNLRHLVLGRGKPIFLINLPKDAQIQIKTARIEPLKHLEILKLGLPKVCFDSAHFLFCKFPNVKDIDVIIDKPAMLTRNDGGSTSAILKYVITRERYSIVLPVDHPVPLLDNYYRYFPTTVGHSLTIKYSPCGKLTSRKANEVYFPDVTIQKKKQHRDGPGDVELNYFYVDNDEYFLMLTQDIFSELGTKLKTLDLDMGRGYAYTLGTELMNGYFLDSYVFKYCKNLKSLRLQYFHLIRCDPTLASNASIQQLHIVNSVIHDQQIMIDISTRLPNLKEVVLNECVMDTNSNSFNYIFNSSHLDRLEIIDNLEAQKKWIHWLLVFTEKGGQKIYRRKKPASFVMMECSQNEYNTSCASDHAKVSIYCASAKVIHIDSAQFHIKMDLHPI